MRMNFQRYNYDNCVYILKRDEEVFLYLLVYVDVILMERSSMGQTDRLTLLEKPYFTMHIPQRSFDTMLEEYAVAIL